MVSNMILTFTLFCFASTVSAAPRIAVLEFELNDITSLPNTPTELQRTATMAPMLVDTLNQIHPYQSVLIANDLQKSAHGGFGYLFHHLDEATRFGRAQHADWIIVSQHSKPSYLFSYLWVYFIDVSSQTTVARYDIELKVSHERVTQHAIESLAKKVKATLIAHGS
jgi:hypothetical protein